MMIAHFLRVRFGDTKRLALYLIAAVWFFSVPKAFKARKSPRGWVFTSIRSANGVVGSCRPVLKG
jgi:hypothetical protein